MTDFEHILAAADDGPLFETSIVAVDGRGALRVTYNWLYSALNCDPSDSPAFAWVLSKLDDTHVSLSPRDQFDGMTLYASVRDDYGWTLQVQAPFSAAWIRAVGRDEQLTMQSRDLLVASFLGFNGRYVATNGSQTSHDGHSGYLLRSVGTQNPKQRMWFLGVSALLQDGLAVPLASGLTASQICAALAANGLDDSQEAVQTIMGSLASSEL